MFKKLICLIKGHIHPLGADKDTPIYELTSVPINGKRYSIKFMPCERCLAYTEGIEYTEAEWQKIIKDETDKYMKYMENYLTKLGIKIDKLDPKTLDNAPKPPNKFWN